MSAVVAFPLAAPANAATLGRQRWTRASLPENAVCIVRRPARYPAGYPMPLTPELALIRALLGQLKPKAYARLLSGLSRDRERGCPYAGVALVMAREHRDATEHWPHLRPPALA